MVRKKRHNFLAQFSVLFHPVWSVWLRVLAQKTTFWLVEILWQPIRSWFLRLTLATKWSTPCERVWKSVPENGVFSCVPFCFRSFGRFARCDLQMMPNCNAYGRSVSHCSSPQWLSQTWVARPSKPKPVCKTRFLILSPPATLATWQSTRSTTLTSSFGTFQLRYVSVLISI